MFFFRNITDSFKYSVQNQVAINQFNNSEIIYHETFKTLKKLEHNYSLFHLVEQLKYRINIGTKDRKCMKIWFIYKNMYCIHAYICTGRL